MIILLYVLKVRVHPYPPLSSSRTLQHPAVLQCLAQCSEVTPYLLVMEFCPLVGHTLISRFCLFGLSQIPHYSCLALDSEAVRATCPVSSQGDLKSYLHSCRVADCETPDPLILQRMACDISSGLLQLHKYNFIHRYTPFSTVICVNIHAQEQKNPPDSFVLPPAGLSLQQHPGAA